MTPEEIEIKIQEVQQLIEQVRAETQKGGNTKERVANLLTQINDILSLINENSSGDDITLEIARQNGDILEGNIYGEAEFDKGGDRTAFAQMSDVYDNVVGDVVTDSTLKGTGINGNALGLSDNKNAEIAGKLDKIASPNNTSDRIINADGSTSSKTDFLRTSQVEVSTNTTAQESWKGKIILITSSCTVTIPAALSESWSCEIATLAGVNLTLAITTPKTWLFGSPTVITERSVITIAQRGNTNSIAIFGL